MNKKNKKNKRKTKKTLKKRTIRNSLKKSFREFKKSLKKRTFKIKEKLLIKNRLKNKYNIVDIPLDDEQNKGSLESSGFVDYHYQRLSNINDFLSKIIKNKDVYLDENLSIELNIKTNKIKSLYSNLEYFNSKLHEKKGTKYVVIVFNILGNTTSHANIILIDNVKQNIEYFEPLGHKKDDSTLEGIIGAFRKKSKILENFMKEIFPSYEFFNISELFKREGFQSVYDSRNGYCVTWSILYIHYRILNSDIDLNIIIQYIYHYINKNRLLRYANFIEKILKI